jgi:hypothetical protein
MSSKEEYEHRRNNPRLSIRFFQEKGLRKSAPGIMVKSGLNTL